MSEYLLKAIRDIRFASGNSSNVAKKFSEFTGNDSVRVNDAQSKEECLSVINQTPPVRFLDKISIFVRDLFTPNPILKKLPKDIKEFTDSVDFVSGDGQKDKKTDLMSSGLTGISLNTKNPQLEENSKEPKEKSQHNKVIQGVEVENTKRTQESRRSH